MTQKIAQSNKFRKWVPELLWPYKMLLTPMLSCLTHLRDFSLSKLLIFRYLWFLFLKNPLKSMVIFRFLL